MTKHATVHIESIITNQTEVAEATDTDNLRPDDEHFDWFFYGYGSHIDRLTKNVIVKEVLAAIAANQQTPLLTMNAARGALTAMAAQPKSATRTITLPIGMTLEPPPEHADADGDIED